jgi:hypothetical protein
MAESANALVVFSDQAAQLVVKCINIRVVFCQQYLRAQVTAWFVSQRDSR